MLFHSEGILKTIWNLGADIEAKLLLLSPEEQTKLSWAKTINSFDQVPAVYKDSFEALVGNAASFPYTVLAPSHAGLMNRTKEKLVCCLDGRVIMLEQARDYLISTCYPIEDISYVQVGSVLLQSWIKIRGVTSSGVLTSTEFKFNTVTDHLFTPIVEKMRPAADCAEEIDLSRERSKFDYLCHLNFKLMNYARRSIMPGEKVVQIILQPEIRVEAFRLPGNSFFRTLCAPHISILTDRELILVQDGAAKRWGKNVQYGGIWNYIPLDKIISISLANTHDDLVSMSIHLPGDDRIASLFSVSNKQEAEMLQSRIEEFRKNSSSHRNVFCQ